MSETNNSEQEEEEEEEQIEDPIVILTQQIIEESLSGMCRIGASYGFSTLNVTDTDEKVEELVDVNQKSPTFGQCVIANFTVLRTIKINDQALRSVDRIQALPYLLELEFRNNKIENIDFLTVPGQFEHLQKADFSQNKIKALPKIECPALTRLYLDQNEIKSIEPQNHSALKFLSLSQNQLESDIGLQNLLELDQLSLSDNKIAKLTDLKNMPKLIKLNLQNNEIASFNKFPVLLGLKELYLDNNKIGMLIELPKLNILKNLEILSILENPVVASKGDDQIIQEILIRNYTEMKKLNLINGKTFTEEEIEEAKVVRAERGEAEKVVGNEEEGLLILVSDDETDGEVTVVYK